MRIYGIALISFVFMFLLAVSLASATDCYQQTANESTACGGLSTGVYGSSGSWNNLVGTYDGAWNTWGRPASGSVYMFANYSKPPIATSAIMEYGFDTGATVADRNNVTIPALCFNQDVIAIRIDSHSTGNTGDVRCWNGTDYLNITNDMIANREFYEEAITWVLGSSIVLVSPADKSSSSSTSVNLTATALGTDLANITYYLWYENSTLLNKTKIDISGSTNTTSLIINSLAKGNYSWNAEMCSATTCGSASSNSTFIIGANVTSNIYPSSVFETDSSIFRTNVTILSGYTLSSVYLNWNGTNYAATLTNSSASSYSLYKSLEIPAGIGLKNWYWYLIYSTGETDTLSANTQLVNLTLFTLCNSSINTPYLNYTFKDESNNNPLNGSIDSVTFTYWITSSANSKTYTFSNSSYNLAYAFCFTPGTKTVIVDAPSVKYSGNGYPIRTTSLVEQSLTSTVTNTILYLLSTENGIYSSFQFVDATTSNQISGVSVTMERQVNGVWVIVGKGTTDSSGMVTFWVNPNFDHRITGVKSGYTNVQETIQPSQSVYTVTMGGQADISISDYRYKGIRYSSYPKSGRLDPYTTYLFGFNVTSSVGNIVSCKIEIRDENLDEVAYTTSGCGSYGGNLSLSLNTGNHTKLYGYYYIDIHDGVELFEVGNTWFMTYENYTGSRNGLLGFFQEMNSLPEWGDDLNRQEFSKIVFFFFISILLVGLFTYFSGYELSNPGASLIIVLALIAFGPKAGLLNISKITPNAWFNQYWIGMMALMMMFAFYLSSIRRQSQ